VIHVEESGADSDVSVVLIHGSLDRAAGMARVARAIGSRAKVIRYDRRGYGRSWPHDGPFSVADQVEDLRAVLGGRRAVLVGHSYGGNVALAGAAALGHQVTGVSTYETPLSWMDWWPGDSAGAASIEAGPDVAAERFLVRLVGQSVWDRLPERTRAARRREGVALVGELSSLRATVGCRRHRLSGRVRGGRIRARSPSTRCRLVGRQHPPRDEGHRRCRRAWSTEQPPR
jgi:pimeloyl-ACP methyl ester carboxylesterase